MCAVCKGSLCLTHLINHIQSVLSNPNFILLDVYIIITLSGIPDKEFAKYIISSYISK